jgi:hypothetical protein
MEWIYVLTLFLSLAAGLLALAGALVKRLESLRLLSFKRFVMPAALIAWVVLIISMVVHLGSDHEPGGPYALSPIEFFRHHPSFLWVGLIPGVALVLNYFSNRPASHQ